MSHWGDVNLKSSLEGSKERNLKLILFADTFEVTKTFYFLYVEYIAASSRVAGYLTAESRAQLTYFEGLKA